MQLQLHYSRGSARRTGPRLGGCWLRTDCCKLKWPTAREARGVRPRQRRLTGWTPGARQAAGGRRRWCGAKLISRQAVTSRSLALCKQGGPGVRTAGQEPSPRSIPEPSAEATAAQNRHGDFASKLSPKLQNHTPGILRLQRSDCVRSTRVPPTQSLPRSRILFLKTVSFAQPPPRGAFARAILFQRYEAVRHGEYASLLWRNAVPS